MRTNHVSGAENSHAVGCPAVTSSCAQEPQELLQFLPAPLPRDGITLLQLGDGNGEGHWATAVIPWVAHLISLGRPVFFVESGGNLYYVSGPLVADACLHDPLLRVHEDRDLTVYTPSNSLSNDPAEDNLSRTDVHGRRFYDCNIPTLHNIQRDLENHDRAYGEAVVVFDDAGMLRPYWAITHREYFSQEPPLRLTPAQTAGWRSSDLLDLAQSRTAPTVVVYDATSGGEHDAQALLAISVMHVYYSNWRPGDTQVHVAVSRRRTLIEPWPQPREVTVPVFEPGH